MSHVRGDFFGGEGVGVDGATHCNHWGICGVAVRECVKRSICRLEW